MIVRKLTNFYFEIKISHQPLIRRCAAKLKYTLVPYTMLCVSVKSLAVLYICR